MGTTFFFQSFKLLGLILAVTYCFFTIDGLLLSYFTLVKSKLENTLPAWNIENTNASKLECAKWKFAALSLSLFFLYSLNYAVALELLQLHTVQVTRHHCNALFFYFNFFPKSKFYPSKADNTSLQVPSCNISNFTQFSAGHKNCPSTRCCKFGMQ